MTEYRAARQEAKFKRQILEKLRTVLADGKPRDPRIVAIYRASVARLDGELGA